MSNAGSEDDFILARVNAATTLPKLLEELQRWYNWGEYDTTGATILTKIGELGQGDPSAIAALERSAKGSIVRTSSAATQALSRLASGGDSLAVAALARCREYRQQHRS